METLAHAIAQKFLRTEIVTVAINGRVDAICVGCIFSTSPPPFKRYEKPRRITEG
jgi:hypothetical protein